jgi:hypothetical protein
MRTMAIGEVRP